MTCCSDRVNVLESYWFAASEDMGDFRERCNLRLMADSGAFSAHTQGIQIDTDEFYAWCRRWADQFYVTAGLDVIGDPDATWTNWLAAPDDLRLMPTIHFGDAPESIDRYVERGVDMIGLGGMVPHKSRPKALLHWCHRVMKYAADNHPHVRFHGWGVTHPLLLNSLPFWSVDSSGLSASYRYGRLRLWDPIRKRDIGVQLDGRSIARHRDMLDRFYGGFDWRSVLVSDSSTRRAVCRISLQAHRLKEQHYQQRNRVTPPPSLIEAGTVDPAEVGPLMFAVMWPDDVDKALLPDPTTTQEVPT